MTEKFTAPSYIVKSGDPKEGYQLLKEINLSDSEQLVVYMPQAEGPAEIFQAAQNPPEMSLNELNNIQGVSRILITDSMEAASRYAETEGWKDHIWNAIVYAGKDEKYIDGQIYEYRRVYPIYTA